MGTRKLRVLCVVCLFVVTFAGSAAAGSLKVQWNHSADSRTSGYLVSYGTQSGKYTASIKTGYVTSVSVTGLTEGTVYYFVVQSYDQNNVVGPPSREASGRVPTTAGPTITCPSPTLTSLDGKPIAVTLTPTISGGVTPVSSSCSPASGSLFPVGTTSFTCTAVDAAQQKASCTSKVVVVASSPTTPPPSGTTTPPSGTTPPASLSATAAETATGAYYARLEWNGLTSRKIDIYRNGARLATQENDGRARSPVPGKATYTYKVCAAGTSTCTNQAKVTF